MKRENLLGHNIVNEDSLTIVADIYTEMQKTGPARWLACLNPHSFVCAKNDSVFASAVNSADYLVADGVGIIIASSFLGGNIRQRVTGSDIFFRLNMMMQINGNCSVFFLGSTEECLSNIRKRFIKDFPAIKLVGTWSPPFKSEWSEVEVNEIRRVINLAKPDVLWVGMTAPKQEKWIYSNLPYLNIKFGAAIGAVFDFYSCNTKRAHPILQGLGLEWLVRLVYQPRKTWRRMAISAPIFVWDIVKYKWRNRG